MTKNASTLSSTTNHDGQNWPYHQYEGSKKDLIGSYVPCANNPCSEHGGSEVYATSPENAYIKAHQNDNWGLSISNNKSSILMPASASNLIKTITAADNATINDKLNASTANSKHNNDSSMSTDSSKTDANDAIDATQSNGFMNDTARDLAISQGLYIDGSQLLHRLTADEKSKYWRTGTNKYGMYSEGIDMQAFARDIFPGVALANDYSDDIKDNSKNIMSQHEQGKKAIAEYSGDVYNEINTVLRTGNAPDDSVHSLNTINKYIQNIDSVMRNTNSVIDKDTVIFRRRYLPNNYSDDRGGEEKAFYHAIAKSMRDGSEPIITRPDFMSTTWNVPSKFDEDVCSYLIKIPAGTRCIDASCNSDYGDDEAELLIDKGYSFKVVGVYELGGLDYDAVDNKTEWSENGHPIIALELVEPTDESK